VTLLQKPTSLTQSRKGAKMQGKKQDSICKIARFSHKKGRTFGENPLKTFAPWRLCVKKELFAVESSV
jgi:hypothetical protein